MKITTEHCVEHIVTNVCPGTNKTDWKRRSKNKVGNYTFRTFENIKTGDKQIVYEKDNTIVDITNLPSTLAIKIKTNLITVDLSAVEFPNATEYPGYRKGESEWTGKFICFINDYDDDGIGFGLGPETKGGYCEDTLDGGCYAKLEVLFKDLNIEVGAAENEHIIPEHPDLSRKEIRNIIIQRLKRSGVTRFEIDEG
jgi:hypothetical protein